MQGKEGGSVHSDRNRDQYPGKGCPYAEERGWECRAGLWGWRSVTHLSHFTWVKEVHVIFAAWALVTCQGQG